MSISATLKPNTTDNSLICEGFATVNGFISIYVKMFKNKDVEGQVYVMFGQESWLMRDKAGKPKLDKNGKKQYGNRTITRFEKPENAEIFKKSVVQVYNDQCGTSYELTPYTGSKTVKGEVEALLA